MPLGAFASEVEAAQEIANILLPGLGAQALQLQDWAGVQIERFELMLMEVTHPQVFSPLPLAGEQWLGAREGFHQRGFARAVGTEQADTTAGVNTQVHAAEQGLAVTEIRLREIEQWVGDLTGFVEAKLKRRIDVRGGDFFHSLKGFQSTLSLFGFTGFGAETTHKVFHMSALGLLFLKGLLLLGQPFGALALKGAVIAPVTVQLVIFKMHHHITAGIDEIPVVGDQHQCAFIAAQPLLQPQAGIEVEVVCGFVEQ